MQGFRFSERTGRLLDRAVILCDRRGGRVTETRRHVLALGLGLVLDGDRPAGAYLLGRLSAFVGDGHDDQDGAGHHHAARFLIRAGCGRVLELADPHTGAALSEPAARAGSVPHHATVEIERLCALRAAAWLPVEPGA